MTRLPDDFLALYPKVSAIPEEGPTYWLWVYDPFNDKVHLEHNEERHPAEHLDHGQMSERIPNRDLVHGFAYRIQGGYRITNTEHKPVDDPHVLDSVRKALKGHKVKSGPNQVQRRALQA